MSKTKLFLSFMLFCIMSVGVNAQTVIPKGTQISVALDSGITTGKNGYGLQHVEAGDPVYFHTTEDVYDDNDNLIIPENTTAIGEVSKLKKRGFWGNGAAMQVTLKELKLQNGVIIPLSDGIASARGEKDSIRKTIFWAFIYAIPLNFAITAMFPKGNHANIAAGYILNATVATTISY